jgi:hypothetical protein
MTASFLILPYLMEVCLKILEELKENNKTDGVIIVSAKTL